MELPQRLPTNKKTFGRDDQNSLKAVMVPSAQATGESRIKTAGELWMVRTSNTLIKSPLKFTDFPLVFLLTPLFAGMV
jgi:hypothetical protein